MGDDSVEHAGLEVERRKAGESGGCGKRRFARRDGETTDRIICPAEIEIASKCSSMFLSHSLVIQPDLYQSEKYNDDVL